LESSTLEEYRNLPPFEPGDALIIITFDDGNETDYSAALPLMEARHIKGTTYVTTSLIGEKGYLTWEQLSRLAAAGWTIGCHTATHPRLSELNPAQIEGELLASEQAFLEQGFPAPRHLAYPHGDYNDDVVALVQQHRLTARAITEGVPLDPIAPDLFRIQASQLYVQDCQSLSAAFGSIDRAIQEGSILLFYTHDVSEDPSPYGAHPFQFMEVLDYIVSRQVKTATMDELYDILQR
jgi:peptidoglycan/xylan/chitin deacetylase (PgdA/CDA1 family)